MENIFKMIKNFFDGVGDTLMTLLSVGIMVQILFGAPVFGVDVIGNVTSLIESLGNSGFVGLLAVIILVRLIDKK
tara:strand:+ start:143 stop:367 length:225 start_codon:yes stop_codon:yes gene_type:complete